MAKNPPQQQQPKQAEKAKEVPKETAKESPKPTQKKKIEVDQKEQPKEKKTVQVTETVEQKESKEKKEKEKEKEKKDGGEVKKDPKRGMMRKLSSFIDLTPTEDTKSPNVYIFGAHIDWRYPKTRTGFMGLVDQIAGPGYTTAETVLLWCYGIGFLLMIGIHNYFHQLDWSWGKHATSLFLSINMGFGVVVSSSPLKRWYHRNGRGITGWALGMVIFEAVFETVIANWVFLDELNGSWNFLWVIGGLSTLSFVVSTYTPLFIKRPMNVGLYMLQVFLATYYLPKIKGMEWYTYVIFTKYLAHLPREEPYRPSKDNQQ